MAVLGRLLISSSERLDLPDLLSIDSYAAGDWKFFLKSLVGDDKPYILKGFDIIDPGNAIGTQSCSIRVADSITYYPGSAAGPFFHGLEEGNAQAAPLVPELRKNAVNYVYLTFTTFNTSLDTRAFWDPDKDGGAGGEFTQDVNTESVLQVQVNVSTGSFPANTVPVAKVTVGPVVITAIEDARDLMFRLGSGGISPDPFNTYNWRSLPGVGYERVEPSTEMIAGGVNPFEGADKNILTLKEWMDAVMSKLRELGGSTFWYDDVSTFNVINNFIDAIASTYKSKGQWIHSTVTPGLLTWTEDVQFRMTSDLRSYILRAGNKTLANEQVMYIPLIRDGLINPTDEAVSWTNGQAYVNTVGGAVGLFLNLAKGDWVRKLTDSSDKWLRVEEFYDAVSLGGSVTTAALARSIRLNGNYLGTTIVEKARYDKGNYLSSDVVVSSRDQFPIVAAGGNFHWIALRSDTIENVSNVVTTTLSCAISEHDGVTAKVTSVAHGLQDGDRVTISGTTNFNGTYKVEVETADIFYITISGGPFANESGSGFYAVATTAARSTPYGFQEESANHCFRTDDTIIVAGTANYNGSYLISVRSDTSFQFATGSAHATETSGTATAAVIIIRNEGAGFDLIQGQIIDIGGSVADNIRQYTGMASLSQTSPAYAIPPSYNTLDGMQNYNGVVGENLTSRISKLTAMMADKAQDKTIKLLPSGYESVVNTTSGSNQNITFTLTPPSGSPRLDVVLPSSANNGLVQLTGTLALPVNSAAYITIDRNNVFSYLSLAAVQVTTIPNVPLEENTLVLAVRLSTTDVWLWDGFYAPVGTTPAPGLLIQNIEQNANLKLVKGGVWAWNTATAPNVLSWDASAYIQIPGLNEVRNTILAGNVTLAADGAVAYVDINRSGTGALNLTVVASTISTMTPTMDRFVIARRNGNDVVVGTNTMLLVPNESKKLYAGASNETLSAIGLATEADKGMLRILSQIGGNDKRIILTPIDTVVYDGTTWGNEIAGLRMKFAGVQIDLQTGQYYAYGDGTLAGSGSLIGTIFTPTTFTSPNLFRWYSINLVADTTNADGTMNVKPLILAGVDGSSSSLATKAPFSSKKIGQVLVQATGTGSTINNIPQTSIVQLLAGAGSGSGAAPKMIGGGLFSNNGASAVVFANNAVTAGALGGLPAAVNWVGQGITAASTGTINSFTLSLRRSGTLTGTISGKVYSDDGTGNHLPLAVLATSPSQSVAALSTSFVPITFTLSTPLAVTSGVRYHVVLDNSGYGGTGQVQFEGSNANPYAGGNTIESLNNGVSFTNDNTQDLVFSVDGTSGVSLSFASDIYIEQARLNYVDNTISQATYSPIVLPTTNHVAFIDRLNASSGGPALTVLIDLITNVKDGQIIIARRDGTDVIVGSTSTRLVTGESKKLFAGVSQQLLNVIPATDNADYTGQLRLLANATSQKRVNVSAVDKITPDNTQYGMQLKNLMLSFTGAQIAFDTGTIYAADGVSALGINFTPATIAASQYRWYSVTLVPSTTTADNRITGQIVIVAGSADGASPALAPKAAYASSGIKLGEVVVQQSGGSIANILQGNIIQLTGGGTSGSGDTTDLLERLKNTLVDSTFDLMTPVIFATQENTLTDVSTTANYDIANGGYTFTAPAQQFVTTNLADPTEFALDTTALSSVSLQTFWKLSGIDTGAVYSVSRNGGNEWQTITMSRIGLTDTYIGSKTFTDESVNQTLSTLTSVVSSFDLNATTQQEIGQAFTTTTKQLIKQVVLELNRTATVPDGNFFVQLVANNAGAPSTASSDVLAESAAISAASLSSGNNSLTVSLPYTYLAPGTYHLVIRTDAAYRATYSGTKRVAWRGNNAASTPYINIYNGTAWSVSTGNQVAYAFKGIALDLRVRIVSSLSTGEIYGLGAFYQPSPGSGSGNGAVTAIKNRQTFSFSGDLNTSSFLLTNFIPDPDSLRVYDVSAGQVYVNGAFTLTGSTVNFTSGQFYVPGTTVTLVFSQGTASGGSFDNSDLNALLMAGNFLGSADANIDRSSPGRGIFLRRPDGTLREITIDNSDNIVVYSV